MAQTGDRIGPGPFVSGRSVSGTCIGFSGMLAEQDCSVRQRYGPFTVYSNEKILETFYFTICYKMRTQTQYQ